MESHDSPRPERTLHIKEELTGKQAGGSEFHGLRRDVLNPNSLS